LKGSERGGSGSVKSLKLGASCGSEGVGEESGGGRLRVKMGRLAMLPKVLTKLERTILEEKSNKKDTMNEKRNKDGRSTIFWGGETSKHLGLTKRCKPGQFYSCFRS